MAGKLINYDNSDDSLEAIKEIITKPFHVVNENSNHQSTAKGTSALSISSSTSNEGPNSIAEFVAQLLSTYTSTFEEADDLITVVNYLDIPLFLHGIAKYIAVPFIHNKTPEQIRTTFGFSDDLDPEEKAEIESGVAFLNEEQ